ncbi:tRNA-dihydrouridine synthase [Haladaptatus sp. AB618]|uniref:tRNA-dihydrouridine synthase n=1 Tax=Haladaptatus sp. AB618 TaxID=2934173 RepID=UPI00209BEFF3|nr:tRNA-dihydrouridine synthase [Haladaptatus sp. AB618]MCO8256435.1 tRNA-dihydrouridine synthase [Haladaptatus sp. AB618]
MVEPFEPRVALASLSGEADAEWARNAADHAGAAFLGGIALDEETRAAARKLVARERTEFLPDDPVAFVDGQLAALSDSPIRPGINVRSATLPPIRAMGDVCHRHGAILELNAHCRQEEMCAAGAGQSLLRDPDRLAEQVRVAAETGAAVSVKVRAEVPGVNLPEVARKVVDAGADIVHLDAMDSERMVQVVAEATDCFLVANNGVRDEATVAEYLEYGADAVSVGRPSDRPEVLSRVRRATDAWFTEVVA